MASGWTKGGLPVGGDVATWDIPAGQILDHSWTDAFAPIPGLQPNTFGRFQHRLSTAMSLTSHDPDAQGLKIYGELHPAAVPLLARLPRLRHLDLHLPLGHGTDAWSSSGTAVAAALMPVVLGAPYLKQLEVNPRSDARFDFVSNRRVPCSQPAGVNLVAALSEGVQSVKRELRAMGWDPDIIGIGYTWSSLLEDA